MPMGAAIGGASIVGSLISANAASKASKAQTAAANSATDIQKKMFEETRADLQPFKNTGQSAAYSLADFYGLDRNGGGMTGTPVNDAALAAFRNSPDYQFALNEGVSALDRSAASKGLLQSGGQLKAVTKYASGLASTNLGSYLDRLYQLSSMGANAGAQTGNFAVQTGRGMADSTLAAGEAKASGYVGVGNAINQGIGDISNNLSFYRMTNPSSSYGASPYAAAGRADGSAGNFDTLSALR